MVDTRESMRGDAVFTVVDLHVCPPPSLLAPGVAAGGEQPDPAYFWLFGTVTNTFFVPGLPLASVQVMPIV